MLRKRNCVGSLVEGDWACSYGEAERKKSNKKLAGEHVETTKPVVVVETAPAACEWGLYDLRLVRCLYLLGIQASYKVPPELIFALDSSWKVWSEFMSK